MCIAHLRLLRKYKKKSNIKKIVNKDNNSPKSLVGRKDVDTKIWKKNKIIIK
tara:strand:- start:402 stop:557 length:156 start_codon:yes stop_codon:yes gene_type:complete